MQESTFNIARRKAAQPVKAAIEIASPQEVRRAEAEKPATMKSAAARDCYPRQHRYDLLGAASCLATAALLPTLAHGPSSLEYELDCFIQEPESREARTQKLTQPIHRQFTSLQRRRCCRLAGLISLTCHYFTSLCLQYQTFVRMLDRCGLIPSSAIRR